ncbi:MAG: phosphoheptose isomerase [Bacteroidia bacterium]
MLNEININGKKGSPVLDKNVKNFMIDIDGTVCEDVPNEEPERMSIVEPFDNAVNICNTWYDQGNVITFFTSRTEETRKITEDWLHKHGFKYHALLMGKPRGGNYHWIDNHEVKFIKYEGKMSTNFVEKAGNILTFE